QSQWRLWTVRGRVSSRPYRSSLLALLRGRIDIDAGDLQGDLVAVEVARTVHEDLAGAKRGRGGGGIILPELRQRRDGGIVDDEREPVAVGAVEVPVDGPEPVAARVLPRLRLLPRIRVVAQHLQVVRALFGRRHVGCDEALPPGAADGQTRLV